MESSVRIKPGMVFCRLTVVSKAEKVNLRTAWNCVCTCGKHRIVLTQSLKSGATKSCGCLHQEIMVGKFQEKAGELIGKRFGKWVVKDLLSRRAKNGGVYFLCECECERTREVSSEGLLSGRSKSCGNCGSKAKPVCKMGHVVADWGGRSPSGACKACVKHKSLMRNYGITLVEYIAIGDFQEWKCAICEKPLDRTAGLQGFGRSGRAELDHEHGGKTVDRKYARGILCGGRWSGCNRKIGRIDNVEWISKVLEYLKNPPARTVLGTSNLN
jgi:Recombination endonuclease VII